MKLLRAFYVSMFLSALLFVSCAQNNGGNENSITVDQLREMMKTDSNLVVLDVRTPQELADPSLGHIDGVLNIPVQELEQRIAELEPYKEKEIAVICRSGRRSSIATGILLKHGFNALNVEGGMLQYRATEKK